jgi:hypothetical protein
MKEKAPLCSHPTLSDFNHHFQLLAAAIHTLVFFGSGIKHGDILCVAGPHTVAFLPLNVLILDQSTGQLKSCKPHRPTSRLFPFLQEFVNIKHE